MKDRLYNFYMNEELKTKIEDKVKTIKALLLPVYLDEKSSGERYRQFLTPTELTEIATHLGELLLWCDEHGVASCEWEAVHSQINRIITCGTSQEILRSSHCLMYQGQQRLDGLILLNLAVTARDALNSCLPHLSVANSNAQEEIQRLALEADSAVDMLISLERRS
jgi:hypothetical protein